MGQVIGRAPARSLGVESHLEECSMKRAIMVSLMILMASIVSVLVPLIGPDFCRGQVGGNIGFSQTAGKARAEQRERANREQDKPPTTTSTFVEANVLMNVKADEYVVVFGIVQEGETLADCNQKMNATVTAFAAELKPLGIGAKDFFVNFITQNKIYGFQVQGDIFQEKLVGFELKKNISIHYKETSQFDKITLAAARAQVFDLIKVDYIIKDLPRVQDRLMEEATRIIRNKMSRYEKLLGIKLQLPAQVYAEKYALHYPTQMYDSFTAYESEEIRGGPDLSKKYAVRHARKTSTFFFNGLDGNGFDALIDPVVTEPVIQCTLYLKVKYEVEQIKAK